MTLALAAGKVRDAAGNFNSASTSNDNGLMYDATPPTTTADPSPAANAAGWNKGDVTVTLQADDGAATILWYSDDDVAGAVPYSPASPPVLRASGDVLHYYAIDRAGNAESSQEHRCQDRQHATGRHTGLRERHQHRLQPASVHVWCGGCRRQRTVVGACARSGRRGRRRGADRHRLDRPEHRGTVHSITVRAKDTNADEGTSGDGNNTFVGATVLSGRSQTHLSYIQSAGDVDYYKVTTPDDEPLPYGSEVLVTLKDLPADYTLAVVQDLGQEADPNAAFEGSTFASAGHLHGTPLDDIGHLHGTYVDDTGHLHGTYVEDIGHLHGTWYDESGHLHGTYIDESGHLHGTWIDESGHLHGTSYEDTGHLHGTPYDDAGHLHGTPLMDSVYLDAGHLHGTYYDESGHLHGTPVFLDVGHLHGTLMDDTGHLHGTWVDETGHLHGTPYQRQPLLTMLLNHTAGSNYTASTATRSET